MGGGAGLLGGTASATLLLLLPALCPDSGRCRCCSCCELLPAFAASEGGSTGLLAFASFSSSSEHSFRR